MKIQLVYDSPTRLADSSIRYERYLRGFRCLGHDASMITTAASAEGSDWAESVPDRGALLDPALWAGIAPDLVLLPTWLGMADLLAAIRPHARHVVALADSDGHVGARAHPRESLARMVAGQPTPAGKLRSSGWWARQYLGLDRSVDRGVVESCRLCDRIVVFSPGAGANLSAFLRSAGCDTPDGGIVVAPYPVDEGFESAPVRIDREDQILAVGRWEDPQKGAGLLAAAVRELIRLGQPSRVVIVGSGGVDRFGPIARANPGRVEYRGVVAPAEVLALMDESRVLLSTSRWESGPIVAAEAVLRGCSVAGPRSIPGFRMFAEAGCGSLFAGRSPRSVAEALRNEANARRDGWRDPRAIADAWRGHFTPRDVCERILRSLGPGRGDGAEGPRGGASDRNPARPRPIPATVQHP
ncbi:glycosyltransferase family 4 protein (plasmid) [Tundrisphaera sp. TA3]|uniref:glycosyltransferase family 4 protein n=1 Tax=Tundrisphaera sp. TA3 TaxID=3435775 RepID=UPI003EBEF8BA